MYIFNPHQSSRQPQEATCRDFCHETVRPSCLSCVNSQRRCGTPQCWNVTGSCQFSPSGCETSEVDLLTFQFPATSISVAAERESKLLIHVAQSALSSFDPIILLIPPGLAATTTVTKIVNQFDLWSFRLLLDCSTWRPRGNDPRGGGEEPNPTG